MRRGVRLVCEECDYQGALFEPRQDTPQAAHSDASAPLPATDNTDDWHGYSHLCPQCVEPTQPASADSGAGADTSPVCPRCASPLLDFESAVAELAAASRSRMILELRAERAGYACVETLLGVARTLHAEVVEGTTSGAEAASKLNRELDHQLSTRGEFRWAPLADTTALAGLPAVLAGAPSMQRRIQLMDDRLCQAERHVASLERCVEDEAELPGVPCPRCHTAHLLHWPIWA
ncbi:MAG TPA: hypothetical protein VF818_11100 [Ktedonobacterales bacterium]